MGVDKPREPDEAPRKIVTYITAKGEHVYPLGKDERSNEKYEIWTINGPVVVTRVGKKGG